jgi:uncharacterized protein YfaS (alpha-2-macroglobulin family)
MNKEGAANKATVAELMVRYHNAMQAQYHSRPGGKDAADAAAKEPAMKKGKAGSGKEDVFSYFEYAFRKKSADVQDTVLWLPVLRLKEGRAEVGFDVPQNPTNYRVLINAHTPDGRLGAYQGTLEVRPKAAK